MSKNITRTVTVYTYTLGKFNSETMTVENIHKESFPYKIGARERRKLESILSLQILCEPTVSEKTYTMDIETFIHHAKEVE